MNKYTYSTGGTTGFRLTDYPDIAVDYFAVLHTTSAAVPEPATGALLVTGLFFLATVKGIRRKK